MNARASDLGRKVIAANWKMHQGPDAARAYFSRFRPKTRDDSVRVLFFPPSLSLAASIDAARTRAEFGVQNIHWDPRGALTGEQSAEMAREAGASLALVGHSERRRLFGETDEHVRLKVRAAARAGLAPVACVGELLEERRAGRLESVLRRQVGAFRDALEEAGVGPGGYMVAYEPVWAIGTGETATPDDAARAHGIVRSALAGLPPCPILYGGSVKPENVAALMAAPDVDGALVGGASLDPEAFSRIVEESSKSAS